MRADAIAALPARPPSEVEWEDLLVRMEVMPRVLRNTLDERPAAAGEPALRELVEREAVVAAWLERVSFGATRAGGPELPERAGRLAERFASLRARNFAMVQRRGLEVWDWTAPFGAAGEVSTFQLLTWLVQSDVDTLAALRGESGSRAGAC